MQDRAFSPESAEEVIELLDIVEPSADMSDSDAAGDVQADADDTAADDTLDLTDIILADAECDEPAPASPADTAGDDVPPEHISEACSEAPGAMDDPAEEEQGMLCAASEGSEVPCEDAEIPMEAPVPAPSVPDISSELEACLTLAAEVDARVRQLEEQQNAELETLRVRLDASEKRCAELTAEVDALQQQLARSSSAILEEPSVRLTLEEMVSRMIELRMPALPASEELCEVEEEPAPSSDASEENFSFTEEAETSAPDTDVEDMPAEPEEDVDVESARAEEESASRQVIIETIEELAQHVSELEERVADWELRCEQEAALAAARVIREEIAALKAGAARLGR